MSMHWPLPERFKVRLSMQSDWHIGSGMGRPGNIDRLITRDLDGLPYIPGKSLRGIWRDSCERLCRGLDDGRMGDWSLLVNRIFGSQPALGADDPTGYHNNPINIPLESALQIHSARIPSPLRDHLINRDLRLQESMTFIKPGVKIDRSSGSAQTDFLRFEEMARTGTLLEAECRLMLPDEMRELVSSLLVCSGKLVERIGGKRRRGAGLCRFEIVGASIDCSIDLLHNNHSAPLWSPKAESVIVDESIVGSRWIDPKDSWVNVLLRLKLQGPLSVSHRTVGNVVETLDFLPGSYLLQHVTRTLSGLGADVQSSLQSGDICVLPATLEVEGERGQPVPLSLFRPKEDKEHHDRNKIVNRLMHSDPNDGTQMKQIRDGYISINSFHISKTPITVTTHNCIEDQTQRPKGAGGLYTYESISPIDDGKPIILRSELRIRNSLADQLRSTKPDWWKNLNGDITLGRSTRDDYGSVIIESEPVSPWRSDIIIDSEIFVWLLSDTLIRNHQLRYEPTSKALGEELSRRLGVTLTPRESDDGRLNELIRVRRLDSWHVGWGLPRPSLVALQAGSCMVFTVTGLIDPVNLERLEASGVGERTAEGYGQLRFNHYLLTNETIDWTHGTQSTKSILKTEITTTIKTNDPAFEFAQILERECWKREIYRVCMKISGSRETRRLLLEWRSLGENGSPPMSQLGGLHGQLSLLRKASDRERVISWLDHLALNKRRSVKWPSISKVREIIDTDTRIWKIIETNGWPKLTDNAESQLRQELWPFAVRCFFDACIRAHKRDLEESNGS